MRYGGHPYFEDYRARDRNRYLELLAEQAEKARRRVRITGRILEARVMRVVDVDVDGGDEALAPA